MPAQEIIGHAAQRAVLSEDIASGNVAHAYLFAGPRHVGKATVARWFARELLTQDQDAAAKEKTLAQIDRLIHPDFLSLDQLWIEEVMEDWNVIAKTTNLPQDHRSKAPRIMRTDTIAIDDVRAIQERLQETGIGAVRCCFIRSIERMQDEAGNALLKILEEPPPGRVFLCTTQNIADVLPTVLSRMRVVHFRTLPEHDLLPIVRDMAEEDREFALHVAQGAPGKLLRLKHDPAVLTAEKLLHGKALGFWSATTLLDRFSALKPLHDRTPEADRFLLHLALTLRELRPPQLPSFSAALATLLREFQTNAHRELLTQKFALKIDSEALPTGRKPR